MQRNKKKVIDKVPDKYQIYKSLFILFKGDRQKMDWFYENKTEADLVLMTYIYNLTDGYGYG